MKARRRNLSLVAHQRYFEHHRRVAGSLYGDFSLVYFPKKIEMARSIKERMEETSKQIPKIVKEEQEGIVGSADAE